MKHVQMNWISMFSGALAVFSFSANAQVDPRPFDGHIPTPFEASNQHVELADGENYFLLGRVVFGSDPASPLHYVAYFEVDLKEHPWLANKNRIKNPVYRLQGGVNYWKQFRGIRVKLPCTAETAIVMNSSSVKLEYVIELRRFNEYAIEVLGY